MPEDERRADIFSRTEMHFSLYFLIFFQLQAAKVYGVTCIYGPLEYGTHFDAINVKTTRINIVNCHFSANCSTSAQGVFVYC